MRILRVTPVSHLTTVFHIGRFGTGILVSHSFPNMLIKKNFTHVLPCSFSEIML